MEHAGHRSIAIGLVQKVHACLSQSPKLRCKHLITVCSHINVFVLCISMCIITFWLFDLDTSTSVFELNEGTDVSAY